MIAQEVPEEYRTPHAVRRALAGVDDRVPPSTAIVMIFDLDIDQSERRRMLLDACQNREYQPNVRALAVLALPRLGVDDACEQALLVLEQPELEEVVASSAVGLLGRLAQPEALDALELVKRSANTEVLRSRAAFAQVVIAQRFGVTDARIDWPSGESQDPPESLGAIQFVSRQVGFPRRKAVIDQVQEMFPQMRSHEHDVYELQCGGQLLAVVVRKSILTPDGVRELHRRPHFPAVVAPYDEESGMFFPAWLALSKPSEKGPVSILLARTTGEPVIWGLGTIGDKGLDIELLAAKAPGLTAINSHVRIRNNQLEITGISQWRALPRRTPEEFAVELP